MSLIENMQVAASAMRRATTRIDAANKVVAATRKFVKWYDDELANSDGEYPHADTGCIDCTEGCVPNDRNTGLCGYHLAQQALREWDATL